MPDSEGCNNSISIGRTTSNLKVFRFQQSNSSENVLKQKSIIH